MEAAEESRRVADSTDPHDLSIDAKAWHGIDLCRQGDWQEGLYWLSMAADSKVETSSVPSLFFSYLGYGMARDRGELEEGLRLCRRAVSIDVYQPENYGFLARALLLKGDRRAAFDILARGLQLDARHPSLIQLRGDLGERRRPVLPFLPRGHFLNRTLGRWRHRLIGPPRRTSRL